MMVDITEGRDMPMELALPNQYNDAYPVVSELSLTQGGNDVTIPLNVILPSQNQGDEELGVHVRPVRVPPDMSERFVPNIPIQGNIRISHRGQTALYPIHATRINDSDLSFNPGGVPQSTNIFQLTFLPHDQVQSTKINDSSITLNQSTVGNNDSTLASSAVLPPQKVEHNQNEIYLQRLAELNKKEQAAKKKLDLDKMTQKNKKRPHHDVSNLQDAKTRPGKVAAVSSNVNRREKYLDEKLTKAQTSYVQPPVKQGNKRSRADVSNLKDTKPKSSKVLATNFKPNKSERWLDDRKAKKQQSFMENRNIERNMIDNLEKFAKDKIEKT